MTNYNERLDEIIAQASAGIGGFGKLDNGKFYKGISEIEAKQALASLYKELVEEAKPPYSPVIANPDTTEEAIAKSIARYGNKQIDQFEQNLLKAVEENYNG